MRTRMTHPPASTLTLAALFTALFVPTVALADEPISHEALAKSASPDAADSILVAVEYRGVDDVRKDLDMVLDRKQSTEEKVLLVQDLQGRAKSYRMLKESDVKGARAKVDAAKAAKSEVEKTIAEKQKKIDEARLKILEQVEGLYKSELDMMESQVAILEGQRKALELELELQSARAQRNTTGFPDTMEMLKKRRELEKKVLEARIDAAKDETNYAKRHTAVLEARRKIFDAETKLIEEKTR